jgi:hypothetical protein
VNAVVGNRIGDEDAGAGRDCLRHLRPVHLSGASHLAHLEQADAARGQRRRSIISHSG